MHRYVFEAEFYIGQTVAFRLDPGSVGLVTGIHVRESGASTYSVTWEDRNETQHFALELRASDRPILADSGKDS